MPPKQKKSDLRNKKNNSAKQCAVQQSKAANKPPGKLYADGLRPAKDPAPVKGPASFATEEDLVDIGRNRAWDEPEGQGAQEVSDELSLDNIHQASRALVAEVLRKVTQPKHIIRTNALMVSNLYVEVEIPAIRGWLPSGNRQTAGLPH